MYIVTGANGFIGSVLVRDLNSRGHSDIIAVDTVPPQDRPGPLSHAEFREHWSEKKLLDEIQSRSLERPKVIFHMGACSDTTETDEDFLYRNNTLYSQKLFEFCAENKIPYIYASSAAVYGDGSKGFDDTLPSASFEPLNAYGRSKAKFDIWVEQQKHRPPVWYGLRFFNVFGPNEYHKKNMSSVAFKAFHQINETGRLKLFKSYHPDYEDGKQLRDFVYVKDVSTWMLRLFEEQTPKNGIYNMGYGQARTWLDLAGAVFSSLNKELDIDWIEMPDNIKNQYQYFTEATMQRFIEAGGGPPEWPLEKAIKDYVQNYLEKQDPQL